MPNGWAWCRLKEICELKGGKRIPAGLSATKEKTNHIYIRVTDMQNNSISDADLVYITDDIFEKIQRYTINKDDLYLTIAGTIGRVGEVPEKFDGMNLTENALKLTNISICKTYLMHILNTKFVQDYFESTYHQVAMPKLSLINASKTIIPVPPLDEQQKIVKEIDTVFSITNNLEIDIVDLESLITRTKSKILDLAIHGRLVPQDPNDEPAEELLKRIATSDNRPYKKLDKNDFPFELPENWIWQKLPDLCSLPITDGTHKTPIYSDKENGVPFLSSKDVTSGEIDWSKIKYITKELHEELYKRLPPQKNDILLAKNGTTGIAAVVRDDYIFDFYVTLALIRPISELILPQFLLYVINSHFCKNQFNDHLTGIGVPNLHLVDINKTVIPLPPINEQARIVSKIEEFFKNTDIINRSIKDC
ncbi:MAG: restriction endonuclease subunit S [Treponema sp.]|nr:restriction endonuclease subunit S [Treponema sp.]